MKNRYKNFKLMLLKKYPFCEVCDINMASQVNHCLYHKHGKLVKEMKIYDTIENCQSCCPNCNTGYGENANSREAKKAHWAKRCAELGRNHMVEWNKQVPEWRKEGFE